MSKNIKLEPNQKFFKLVDTSKDLFYRYGIRRVTIEEICREAGVSKMTFYKFFANKLDLAKYLLNMVFNDAIEEYQSIIESDMSFPEKTKSLIDLKRRSSDNISEEFIAELLQQSQSEISEIYNEHRKKSFSITMNFLEQAQKNGDIRQDIKLEFIPYILNKMIDMSADETLGHIYPSPQDYILEMTNLFFYGILKRD